MKRIGVIIMLLCATWAIAADNVKKKVVISQFVDHPALNKTTQGIIDGLAKHGYKRGVNLDLRVESAQANTALATQIAAKFIAQQPDVVVGVATISAQSFMKYAKKNQAKLIFSSVTDPLQAGLVQSINKPGNQTSGVSNFIALEPQIELFQTIQPQLKRLGFLYNPSELNSLSLLKQLQALCPQYGITLQAQAANKTAEVAQAATKLAAKVDAIFISNDSTALSALRVIVSAANKVKVPVYVSDTDAVELGALAALGPNQYQLGLQTADKIVSALNGEDLGTQPVAFPSETALYLNARAAAKLGITFSPALTQRAAVVIAERAP